MNYLIAPNGQFVRRLEGDITQYIDQIRDGYQVTVLAPPRTTDYWNGTNWVAIGPAPDWYFAFNYDTKSWEDTRDLEEVKREKKEAIKMARNQREFGGFMFRGKKFDSDMTSQGRLIASYILKQTIDWTLADDTVMTLKPEDFEELLGTLAMHVQTCHIESRTARKAVDEATTIAEVDAVLI